MIVGFPPFFSDSPTETCKKIMNWKQYLKFPPESKISAESKDLIRKLVTDIDKRIGHTGSDEIKEHPFFAGIDWKNIKKHKPMFVPEVKSKFDTKYFDKFDEEEDFYPSKEQVAKQISKDICFVDFDFDRTFKKKTLIELVDNEEFVKATIDKIIKEDKEKIVNVNQDHEKENKIIPIPNINSNTMIKQDDSKTMANKAPKLNILLSNQVKEYSETVEMVGDSNKPHNQKPAYSLYKSTTIEKEKNDEVETNREKEQGVSGFIQLASKTPKENKNINFSKFIQNYSVSYEEKEKEKDQYSNKRNYEQPEIAKNTNTAGYSSFNKGIKKTESVKNNINVNSSLSNADSRSPKLGNTNKNPSSLKNKLQLKLDIDDSSYTNSTTINPINSAKTSTNAYISKNKGSLTLKKDSNVASKFENNMINKEINKFYTKNTPTATIKNNNYSNISKGNNNSQIEEPSSSKNPIFSSKTSSTTNGAKSGINFYGVNKFNQSINNEKPVNLNSNSISINKPMNISIKVSFALNYY